MQQKNFKEQFPKNPRPEITDLQLFRRMSYIAYLKALPDISRKTMI